MKPNIGELAALSGKSELTETTMDEAAKNLIQNGKAEIIVVSLGAKGAVLYSEKGKIQQPSACKSQETSEQEIVWSQVWFLFW
ncbi:PfkB family carbohydrate kinase [Sphingobacterium sp. KU25419]|nr:PfkB family carbohydrate kinase [Sphingobacterium sp. KU25419]